MAFQALVHRASGEAKDEAGDITGIENMLARNMYCDGWEHGVFMQVFGDS